MDLRKPRLRFDDFFSRLWLLIACRRRSFPAPLSLKRFFALRDVFIFCIGFHSPIPERRENHDHVATVEDGLLLDRAQLLHVAGEPHEEVATPLRVERLAPPEHDRDLHLRPLVEEADDVPLLGLVVVVPDLRSELDLLDLDLELVLAGLLCALFLLVAVLRVVHDPGDRRVRIGRDLDEIEPLLECELERLLRLGDPDLPSVLVDETDARDANLLVDALVPLARNDPVHDGPAAARSQRLFTKLSVPSLQTTKPLQAAASLPVRPSARLNPRRSHPGGEEAVRSCLQGEDGTSRSEINLAPTPDPPRRRVSGRSP